MRANHVKTTVVEREEEKDHIETILIVEPRKNQRLLLEEEMAYEGYATIAAASMRDASDLLARHVPDLILLDLRSRHGDGIEFLSRLADDRCRPAVVIHSADAACQDGLPSELVDACVLKSSNLSKLTSVIHQVLAARRRRGPLRPADTAGARVPRKRSCGLSDECPRATCPS